jgi:hypothetical protein
LRGRVSEEIPLGIAVTQFLYQAVH